MTWLKRIAASLLAAAILIYAAAYLTMPTGPSAQEFRDRGDRYDVEIIRDAYGVPHIVGDSDADVAFGLAVAHARDDFATIQSVVLATRGQNGTANGIAGAKTDYLVHFMGVWDAVDAGYDSALSPKARAVAEAYADGINYVASENPGLVSPYLLPVTGKDLIAGFTFKAPLFYGFDKTIAAVFEGRYGRRLASESASLLPTDQPDVARGSQGLAVAPARSSDGETYLLVNSHQPLSGPVAWYEARVKSGEGWDMVGATFPGSPVILHGVGPTLGWSSTVNKPDLVDVYQLQMHPDKPLHYRLDDQWVALEEDSADITVHFWGPIRWTVSEPLYRSRFGPVLKTDAGFFAVRWAGMGEVRTLDQYLAMNKARTITDFEAALAIGAMPSINQVYGDRDGHIAHYYNAMFPDRPDLPGVDWGGLINTSDSRAIWDSYLPFTRVPATRDPASGAVFNANNRPDVATDGPGAVSLADFPRHMGLERAMTNRAQRLLEQLQATPRISWQDFRSIKYDDALSPDSPTGARLARFLARGVGNWLGETRYQQAYEHLKAWNWRTDADNRHAALAMLTIYPDVMARLGGTALPPITSSFKGAVDLLQKHHGRVDIAWGAINRLVRGEVDLALDGGPDILRAVYGWPLDDQGRLLDVAGDSYILMASWDKDGLTRAESVHSFGSATLDEASPHFSDQAPLFAAEQEKQLHLNPDGVRRSATRISGFGRYHNP